MWKTHKLIYQLCFCFSSWKTTFWGLPSAAPICTDNSQGLGHRCHPGILLSLSSWEFPLYLSCAVFSIWWIPYLPLNWFTLKFWFLFFSFKTSMSCFIVFSFLPQLKSSGFSPWEKKKTSLFNNHAWKFGYLFFCIYFYWFLLIVS